MQDAPDPVRPRYDGAWIGGVLHGLFGPTPPEWLPAAAVAANRVVVLVLDGLGWEMLRDNAPHMPALAGMDGGPITCAVPSTTASGLPSITLGMSPAEHGMLGYRMGVDHGVMNVLRWRMDGGRRAPKASEIQPLPAFGGRKIPTIARSEFDGTGFTDAHLAGAAMRGWQTPAVLRANLRTALASDARVIYCYYDGIDKVAHAHGLTGSPFVDELADADRLVAEMRALIPSDGALVVTADHGHVAVGPEQVIRVDVDKRLIKGLSGESRFRSIYSRANRQAALLEACQEAYGDVAWVFTREQLFDEGWLGPDGPVHFRRRIGDVVLAPYADVAFHDPATPREDQLRSRHGSLTSAEMLVPLLAATGTSGS